MSTAGHGEQADAAPGPDATRTGQHAAADLAPGTVLAQRFRIEGLLGIGGMGVVYRATDLSLGIPVAIKVLRPEIAARPDAFERFRNELLLARQVSSPHVLRIHDIARDGERWLISMDLVEGRPLDRVIDERGALPVEEALGIARQIALGLGAAHAQGVVHRDLKPSNVLVAADGRAWVGDFGIARSLGGSGLTHTGQVVGTPDYLSPEQARAEPVDARSDLYTLGLVLHEMLTGRLPFSGGTPAEALSQRLVARPPLLRTLRPDAPAWVEHLLERLLQPRPAHRFPDADAVVRAIDARHVARPFPWRLVAGVALAASLVAIAVAWWPEWRPPAVPVASLPDRVVVLPVENATGDASLDASLPALADLLRLRLAGLPLAIVDGERVEQATTQLALAGREPRRSDLRELREALPARTIVHVRLEKNGRGFRALGRIQAPGVDDGARQADGADAAAALDALAGELAKALAPEAALPPSLMAKSMDARTAYAQGAEARRKGRWEDAASAFARATAAEPVFAAGWLAQAQAALLAGHRDIAADAAAHGREHAPAPALRARLDYWDAMAGADPEPVLAALQRQVASRPDDLDAQLRLASLQAQAGDQATAATTLKGLLARDGNDPRAWFLLGKASILGGQLRPAVDDQLVRALVLYKRGHNAYGEAETVNALGVGYLRLGQADDAAEQFRAAMQRRRELGDSRGVASTLRNLAQLATVQGRFDEAKAQLEEARGLFARLADDDGLQAVDNELGLLAEERGDFVAADAAYRRMLRSREQAGDAAGVAESLNNIGYAQYQLGDYASAQVFWQQAEAAFVAQRDLNGQVRSRQNLGLLEIARGHWPQARKLLDASLVLAERQQMVEEAAVSHRNLAELDLLQGRSTEAASHLGSAHSLFEARGDQRGLVDVELLRIELALAGGNLDAAEAGLAAPDGALAEASSEQAAMAALLRARLATARGQTGSARAALAQARARAAAAGVARWRLEAELLASARPTPALREAIATLGNVPLQLQAAEHAMRGALAAGDAAGAAEEYRHVAAQLATLGPYRDAATLYELGATALAATGDDAGAREAHRRAAQVAPKPAPAAAPAPTRPAAEPADAH